MKKEIGAMSTLLVDLQQCDSEGLLKSLKGHDANIKKFSLKPRACICVQTACVTLMFNECTGSERDIERQICTYTHAHVWVYMVVCRLGMLKTGPKFDDLCQEIFDEAQFRFHYHNLLCHHPSNSNSTHSRTLISP